MKKTMSVSNDNFFVLDNCGILALKRNGEEVERLGYLRSEDFLSSLSHLLPSPSTPILPQNTIAYKSSSTEGRLSHHCVIEISNFDFVMNFKPRSYGMYDFDKKDGSTKRSAKLNYKIPFLYFAITIREYQGKFIVDPHQIFCLTSLKRITSLDANIYAAFLPNIDASGRICSGAMENTSPNPENTLNDVAGRAIETFLYSDFNEDLIHLGNNDILHPKYKELLNSDRDIMLSSVDHYQSLAMQVADDEFFLYQEENFNRLGLSTGLTLNSIFSRMTDYV